MTELEALQRVVFLRRRLGFLIGPDSPIPDPYMRMVAGNEVRSQVAAAEAAWGAKRRGRKISSMLSGPNALYVEETAGKPLRAVYAPARKTLAELRDSRRGADWLEYTRRITRRP